MSDMLLEGEDAVERTLRLRLSGEGLVGKMFAKGFALSKCTLPVIEPICLCLPRTHLNQSD